MGFRGGMHASLCMRTTQEHGACWYCWDNMHSQHPQDLHPRWVPAESQCLLIRTDQAGAAAPNLHQSETQQTFQCEMRGAMQLSVGLVFLTAAESHLVQVRS